MIGLVVVSPLVEPIIITHWQLFIYPLIHGTWLTVSKRERKIEPWNNEPTDFFHGISRSGTAQMKTIWFYKE
jgi:hypothetical protein